MYTLEDIFHKEDYSNHEYRKEATQIIENSKNPITDLENLAKKEETPSSYLNTAIPLIHALQNNTLNKKDIPSAKEYLDIVDQFLSLYPISETEVCIPFYFDVDRLLVKKYLWPDEFFHDPMYFFLPDMESFKERLDEYLEPFQNDHARYKFLLDLRIKASNSIRYLENRIEELKAYQPFLKRYASVVKTAKSKAQDIHFLAEQYLAPLASTPIKDLKGTLKGKLPTWECPPDQIRILYNKLKGKYIDPSTSFDDFAKLFKGEDFSTFKTKIIWIDTNPKNKKQGSSKSILRLFKILAFNDCIDRRYGTDGVVVRDIAHECFLVDGKPPKKTSMAPAWSGINVSSNRYKELQDIIQSLKSSNTK